MSVGHEARIWSPFRELYDTVDAAIFRKRYDAVHDLEVLLKRHKPDFISLLHPPPKNTSHLLALKKATTDGIPIQGEQRSQTFSQQFIDEAIILSNLFNMNEIASAELLLAGQNQQPNFPGLTRGLASVLLYYDGQRSLVNSLRTLIQSREGRTWTLELSSELVSMTTKFTDQLVEEGLTTKILDILGSLDLTKELEKLQKERALGNAKHRKQVMGMLKEIRQSLAECLFCLACQHPLNKADTIQLIAFLRGNKSLNSDGSLDSVTCCLLIALLYCFDVSLLEREDAEEITQSLPAVCDASYIADIHREIRSDRAWQIPGLRAVVMLSWGLTLRVLSQFLTVSQSSGNNEVFEDDELLIDSSVQSQVFSFLEKAVLKLPEFHNEEFYLRRVHSIICDFIFHMPLKVKEIRNRGDEAARILIAHLQEGIEPPRSLSKDFDHLMTMIGALYIKDPLNLELALDFWCPSEFPNVNVSVYQRPPQRQVALFKFVRSSGDLLPASLYVPYITMLTGLASSHHCAYQCFNLLKMNGMNMGGPASSVSLDHFFLSLDKYYASLRNEMPVMSERTPVYQAHSSKGITPQEIEGLTAILKLTRHIAELNDKCRIAVCENQQWSVHNLLFGLVACAVPPLLKAEMLRTLAALAKSEEIAASLWQSLEMSQILPTLEGQTGGIQVELEDIESSNEEYPMTRAFLSLLNNLTDIPIPAALGAGFRAPGFDPYLVFLRDSVFLRFLHRAYKSPEEKWEIASSALEIFYKVIRDYDVTNEDFVDTVVELQSGVPVVASKPVGFTLLVHMLNNSGLLSMILRILNDSINVLEQYASIPGQSYMEKSALLSLQIVEQTLQKQDIFLSAIRDSGSSVLVTPLDQLLLGINPSTGKADHLLNIANFVKFNSTLPSQTLSAIRVLYFVCAAAPVQSELVSLFTANEAKSMQLLHGFVDCLESDESETQADENTEESMFTPPKIMTSRQQLVRLMLMSLSQPAPNIAHFLLGFEYRKPVVMTNLQDPGVLGADKTCLHSIIAMLNKGVGTKTGPDCLVEIPRLAELSYELIYMLCANKDTSSPTLRYLRTTHDFLYRQLQHLPYRVQEYQFNIQNLQSWLLKTVAIELRVTSLNRQRSHTQRYMNMLLDNFTQDNIFGAEQSVVDETEFSFYDRDRTFQSSSFSVAAQGQQTKRKILTILDSLCFEQEMPESLRLEFFDPKLIEQVINNHEYKTERDIMYCDVKTLYKVLTVELNNIQGTVSAGQRPLIEDEIRQILAAVVARNKMRESLNWKRQGFEAWRHVIEILLTACPEDLLTGEMRQMILFEILQDLLLRVAENDTVAELTAPVAGVVLTLMANLRLCFFSVLDRPCDDNQTPSILANKERNIHSTGSRTLYASSLQIILKGVIDYILKSSGGQQRVRANLYGALLYCLQIAQKQKPLTTLPGTMNMGRILSSDDEFEQLSKENLSTILSYGDILCDVICRDSCDGHDVGRMLALSVLDTVVAMDKYHQWLNFMSSKGYIQYHIDNLSQDDELLQQLLGQRPDSIRAMYTYESKMSVITRIAESATGAHILLSSGLLRKLETCTFLDMRPEIDRLGQVTESGDDFIPSPLARYRQLLFATLKMCLALLTSLGVENREACTQVMRFIVAHGEPFSTILHDRSPSLNINRLRELSLLTAVICRATHPDGIASDGQISESAMIEFQGQIIRIQRLMIALLPKYCFSEKLNKQLKNLASQNQQTETDPGAQMKLAYQQIAANITSFCRTLVSSSGTDIQYGRILFSPNLEEGLSRDLHGSEDLTRSTVTMANAPNLGLVVYQLKQSTTQFLSVYDSYQQHQRKYESVRDLTSDDLKIYAIVSGSEKMTTQQRQQLARKRLQQILQHKVIELQNLCFIVENCLYLLWFHLEYYLIHCVPASQQPALYQVFQQEKSRMRKLQDFSDLGTSLSESSYELSKKFKDVPHPVTKDEIDELKAVSMNVIGESLLKRIVEVNQVYGKKKTHYSFTEAIVRRIKRLLRLHTGN